MKHSFNLSSRASNKFPFNVDFINSESQGKYFIIGGSLAEFEQFNEKAFNCSTESQFLKKINKHTKKNKTYQNATITSLASIYGIPCFRVDNLFPWDDPNDNILNCGIHIEGVGIGITKSADRKYFEHEIIHAVQNYYIEKGIMPKPRGFLNTRDDAFLRIRKETYAYWIGSPRQLCEEFDLLCDQLTGKSPNELENCGINSIDLPKMIDFIKLVGQLNKTTPENKMQKAAIAVHLYRHHDFAKFYQTLESEGLLQRNPSDTGIFNQRQH